MGCRGGCRSEVVERAFGDVFFFWRNFLFSLWENMAFELPLIRPTPRLQRGERKQTSKSNSTLLPGHHCSEAGISRHGRLICATLCRRRGRFDALLLWIRGTVHLWQVTHVRQRRSFQVGRRLVCTAIWWPSSAGHTYPSCGIVGGVDEITSIVVSLSWRCLLGILLGLAVYCGVGCSCQGLAHHRHGFSRVDALCSPDRWTFRVGVERSWGVCRFSIT